MSTIIKLMEVVTETIIIIAGCQMVKSQNFIYALLIWRRKALKKCSYFRNLLRKYHSVPIFCNMLLFLSATPFIFSPCSISLSSILSLFRPIQYFTPFLSISVHRIHIARLSLSRHSTFCTFFPLLPSNTCFLSHRSHM
jgi:hypothetical protein